MKTLSFVACLLSLFVGLFFGSYYYNHYPLDILHENQRAFFAAAVVQPTKGSDVHGVVRFMQARDGVHIHADIHGLTPGKHGFHVHKYGVCESEDAMCTGDHFNPTNAPHGAPADKHVHAGDFGNIVADKDGHGVYRAVNNNISLFGPHSIVGRSVIIHQDPDDLTSQPTGKSGKRIACGSIAISDGNWLNE